MVQQTDPQLARPAPECRLALGGRAALGSLGPLEAQGAGTRRSWRGSMWRPSTRRLATRSPSAPSYSIRTAWVTDEDVTQGLDKFEQVLAEVVAASRDAKTTDSPRREAKPQEQERMQTGQGGAPLSTTDSESATISAGPPDETAEAPDDFEESDDDSPDGEPEPTS